MSRLAKIPVEQWDPELRTITAADSGTPLEQGLMRIFAHTPRAAIGMVQFAAALRANRLLSDRLTELVRLRIAFHNQCRSCMAIRYQSATADGVDEALVCSLERPAEAPGLSPADRAALDYADRFATDHLSIDDATYDGLRAHFTEAEIVELGMWTAFCVGFGRLGATLDMTEELPDGFQDKSRTLTPWGEDAVAVRG